VLSPRTSIEALDECASLVRDSQKLVLFSAPFRIHDVLDEALQRCSTQVLGLLNRDSVISEALHQASHVQLAAASALNDRSILEQWQGRLHQESMHHSGVFIHTKVLLVDPLSENPIVVTGSANFSDNSSTKNDENQLFFFGETAVADVYFGEFMRMFDHYHFRDHARRIAKQRKTDPQAGFLRPTDDWTDAYFGGERDRLRRSFF
jgi:phosphatidylserine/phosphatidylglycerophosphate/cardiolipin synthase-like enzyme